MKDKIKVSIIIMIIGSIICALGIYLPIKVGIIVQEVSSIAIFLALYYISSIIKGKKRVLSNILKWLSIFFLVAIVVSLLNTLWVLFN